MTGRNMLGREREVVLDTEMNELPFFYDQRGSRRFAVLHSPVRGDAAKAILMCHPFGEEKLWSHRVFVSFAREAAKRNVAILRFDMCGHGDSAGGTENCSVESLTADIAFAIAVLKKHCSQIDKVSLLGLRFGATLAMQCATEQDDVDHVILWEPILDGRRYVQELLRINLGSQLATLGRVIHGREKLVDDLQRGEHVNVDGYLISKAFYDQCIGLTPQTALCVERRVKCLVVQISSGSKQQPRKDLVELSQRYPSGVFRLVQEPPFWREIKPFRPTSPALLETTLNWCEGSEHD